VSGNFTWSILAPSSTGEPANGAFPFIKTTQYSILQTCIPSYRLALFDELAQRLGNGLGVVAGDRFFDPTLVTAAAGRSWYKPCRNHFLFANRALWQGGAALKRLTNGPLVVEGNPRCLRTWLLLLKMRHLRIPVAVWGHALGRGAVRMAWLRRVMYALADSVFCYCYEERAALTKLFPGKRVIAAGNSSVRRADCYPIASRQEDRNEILFVGRLVSAKKPMLLLRAVKIIQDGGHPIGAVIVGDGPQKTMCEDFVRSMGLRQVRFAGAQFGPRKIRELAANCFAAASSGYVGLSALDALSLGLPVAYCPAEPNAPEVEALVPESNALKFPCDSTQELARVLIRFYEERATWLTKSSEYCALVADRYSIEHMADEFESFFRKAPGHSDE